MHHSLACINNLEKETICLHWNNKYVYSFLTSTPLILAQINWPPWSSVSWLTLLWRRLLAGLFNSWQMMLTGIQPSMTDAAFVIVIQLLQSSIVYISLLYNFNEMLEQYNICVTFIENYLLYSFIIKSICERQGYHRFSGCPVGHHEVVWSSLCPCTGRKEPW